MSASIAVVRNTAGTPRSFLSNAGTVMEHGKPHFRYWIAAMFLPTGTKKSLSTEELRRQSGHRRYRLIRETGYKLRDMGECAEHCLLADQMELDEGFLAIGFSEDERDEPLERGHDSQRKDNVIVMAESASSEEDFKKVKSAKTVGCLKMQVIPDLKSEIITGITGGQLKPSVELATDDTTSYVNFGKHAVATKGRHFRQKGCQILPAVGAHCHRKRQEDAVGCSS